MAYFSSCGVWTAAVLAAGLGGALSGCTSRTAARDVPAKPAASTASTVGALYGPPSAPGGQDAIPVHFVNVAERAGIHYRWTIPGGRPLDALQGIGNGCAFLDYDGDGNLDILLVGPTPALYRGNGKGKFTDVSAAVGLKGLSAHFLGCAVGDYDNDGFPDVYLSGYETARLLHNERGTHFKDVTAAMGLTPQPWGTSCAFADLDGDGYLDLYVANYFQFGERTPKHCQQHGITTVCGPHAYSALHGVLYQNRAGHGFEDVTNAWGADKHTGNGLGVAFADFDGSGRVGLAVANDELRGDLFQNVGGGQLKNINVAAGVIGSREGKSHGGMGIDWGDVDNDGKLDLFVTTFQREAKTLYHNQGAGLFKEESDAMGIESVTSHNVAWGTKFLDADNDGNLDLIIANGHLQDNIMYIFPEMAYRQPMQFLHQRGGTPVFFNDESDASGVTDLGPLVGRGLATGDFDNDGRIDALVVDSEGRVILLHNETKGAGHWIGFRLIGTGSSNRDAYGAVVTVTVGGRTLMRHCHADGSYLSSSDPRVHFGLGKAERVERVTVRWPDGRTETRTDLALNRYHEWIEGSAEKTTTLARR